MTPYTQKLTEVQLMAIHNTLARVMTTAPACNVLGGWTRRQRESVVDWAVRVWERAFVSPSGEQGGSPGVAVPKAPLVLKNWARVHRVWLMYPDGAEPLGPPVCPWCGPHPAWVKALGEGMSPGILQCKRCQRTYGAPPIHQSGGPEAQAALAVAREQQRMQRAR